MAKTSTADTTRRDTVAAEDGVGESLRDLSLCARVIAEALCRIYPTDVTDVMRTTVVERVRRIEMRLGND